MSKSKLPKNWDDARVKAVLEHYESQSDEEATAEDEAAYNATTSTSMDVPELITTYVEVPSERGPYGTASGSTNANRSFVEMVGTGWPILWQVSPLPLP